MTKRTMIQYFEWYLKSDPPLYQTLMKEASGLSKMGFTHVWLPPAYKGQAGINDVGYGVYDMYDLGEFDQKGSIRTKYGTKDEYIQAIDVCHQNSLQVIADIVFNHRMGADEKETIKATAMDWDDRNRAVGQEKIVDVWTKYTFPVRNGKYSKFQWTWKDFDGTDYDAKTNQNVLMTFEDKKWDPKVSKEEGNFDFIMGDDLDFQNPNVIEELYHWGKWYKDFTNIDGYRLDAVKSIDSSFFKGWLDKQKSYHTNDVYAVGEYWSGDLNELNTYLNDSGHCMHLFDVPLHYSLFNASSSYDTYDMSRILDHTLVSSQNEYACPFVDNHDTQPGQALYSWVQGWFKLHAYSLILLRNFDNPCVFYGDLYGIEHDNIGPVTHLSELVWIRSRILEDEIEDRFDDFHCIGWKVDGKHPIVVVMTNGLANGKEFVIKNKSNIEFIDLVTKKTIKLDENGRGKFDCFDGGCSIFIESEVYQKMKEELEL